MAWLSGLIKRPPMIHLVEEGALDGKRRARAFCGVWVTEINSDSTLNCRKCLRVQDRLDREEEEAEMQDLDSPYLDLYFGGGSGGMTSDGYGMLKEDD